MRERPLESLIEHIKFGAIEGDNLEVKIRDGVVLKELRELKERVARLEEVVDGRGHRRPEG